MLLVINVFIFLIDLKYPIKGHRCKFKTDIIVYSKLQFRTTYGVTKTEPSVSLKMFYLHGFAT